MSVLDAIFAAMLTVAGTQAQPVTISGQARVVDGDTIAIGRTHIRLHGIDSPEIAQRCTDDKSRPFNCGELAADVLQEEIGGAQVECFPVNVDRFRRIVAVCKARNVDLGRRMVERGYAVDYRFFSGGRYEAAEREAREARRGLWSGEWIAPRQWRQENGR